MTIKSCSTTLVAIKMQMKIAFDDVEYFVHTVVEK
jgi:hypothetical protein